MKDAIKLVYAGLIGIALWFVYKLFVKDKDEEQGDSSYNNTTQSTGLSSEDLVIFNKV